MNPAQLKADRKTMSKPYLIFLIFYTHTFGQVRGGGGSNEFSQGVGATKKDATDRSATYTLHSDGVYHSSLELC